MFILQLSSKAIASFLDIFVELFDILDSSFLLFLWDISALFCFTFKVSLWNQYFSFERSLLQLYITPHPSC